MATASVIARVYEKIIARLLAIGDVTKYVGSGSDARVYGAYISTIQDAKFPAISLHLKDSNREVDGAFLTNVLIQMDLWFMGTGKQAHTWDDVMECHQAIVNDLHVNGGWDNTIGIKILQMKHENNGPQLKEADTGLLHLPTFWRVRASV
jgi:hypothetical protein